MNNERKRMIRWMRSVGRSLKHPSGENTFVTNVGKDPNRRFSNPFPENRLFESFPVLSDKMRERIYREVAVHNDNLKTVSARYGVDVRRVAAVVRMKAVEKQWVADKKPLALPYARAVLSMLPSRTYSGRAGRHEPVNEIHVHSYTQRQLFVPVSESRQFTRADAARAFGDHILPADERLPVPELVGRERDRQAGVDPDEAAANFEAAVRESEAALAARADRAREAKERRTTRVDTGRFEFRFESFDVDDCGKKGRSRRGVGWRYGMPFYDRRRGEVKIPTKME